MCSTKLEDVEQAELEPEAEAEAEAKAEADVAADVDAKPEDDENATPSQEPPMLVTNLGPNDAGMRDDIEALLAKVRTQVSSVADSVEDSPELEANVASVGRTLVKDGSNAGSGEAKPPPAASAGDGKKKARDDSIGFLLEMQRKLENDDYKKIFEGFKVRGIDKGKDY